MKDEGRTDYGRLDQPAVLRCLFHPRTEWAAAGTPAFGKAIQIPVEPGITVAGRFHEAGPSACTLLFFHGNGEVVSDYDNVGRLFARMRINFFPVGYRGYGRSTGQPTASTMMHDAHTILDSARQWLAQNGYSGPLAVMGRSLGSASALELAARCPDRIDGLIIESGFAYTVPLLQRLGVDVGVFAITEEDGFGNLDKIRGFAGPVLIIHAERDHIIPWSDGQALHEASTASDKVMVTIPMANHNDILARGLSQYVMAIKEFVARLGAACQGT
jgi:pimeloyl-ACP methyl ester carboxylesterase